jgi:hypothetical protein
MLHHGVDAGPNEMFIPIHVSHCKVSRSGLIFKDKLYDHLFEREFKHLKFHGKRVNVPGDGVVEGGFWIDMFAPTCFEIDGQRVPFTEIGIPDGMEPLSEKRARLKFANDMQKKVEKNIDFFRACLTEEISSDSGTRNTLRFWNTWTDMELTPILHRDGDGDADDSSDDDDDNEESEFLTPEERLVDPAGILKYVPGGNNYELFEKLVWRKCPRRSCSAVHEKVSGCYVVWCPECKFKFDWNYGTACGGHNPMESEYNRSLAAFRERVADGRAVDFTGVDLYELGEHRQYYVGMVEHIFNANRTLYTSDYLNFISLLYGTWEEMLEHGLRKYLLTLIWPIMIEIENGIMMHIISMDSDVMDNSSLVRYVEETISRLEDFSRRSSLDLSVLKKGLRIFSTIVQKYTSSNNLERKKIRRYTDMQVMLGGWASAGNIKHKMFNSTPSNYIPIDCKDGCFAFPPGIYGSFSPGSDPKPQTYRPKCFAVCEKCHRFVYHNDFLPGKHSRLYRVLSVTLRHLDFVFPTDEVMGRSWRRVVVRNEVGDLKWQKVGELDNLYVATSSAISRSDILGETYTKRDSVWLENTRFRKVSCAVEGLLKSGRAVVGGGGALSLLDGEAPKDYDVYTDMDPMDVVLYMNLKGFKKVNSSMKTDGYGEISMARFFLPSENDYIDNPDTTAPLDRVRRHFRYFTDLDIDKILEINSRVKPPQESSPVEHIDNEIVTYEETATDPYHQNIFCESCGEYIPIEYGLQCDYCMSFTSTLKYYDRNNVVIVCKACSFKDSVSKQKYIMFDSSLCVRKKLIKVGCVSSAILDVCGRKTEVGRKINNNPATTVDVIFCQGMRLPENYAKSEGLSRLSCALRFIETEFDISVSKTCIAWDSTSSKFTAFSLYPEDLASRTFGFAFHPEMRANIYKTKMMMKRCEKYQREKGYSLREGSSMTIHQKTLCNVLRCGSIYTEEMVMTSDVLNDIASRIAAGNYTLPNGANLPKTLGDIGPMNKKLTPLPRFAHENLLTFRKCTTGRYVGALKKFLGPQHRICLDATPETQFMSFLLRNTYCFVMGDVITEIPRSTGNINDQLTALAEILVESSATEAATLLKIPDAILLTLPICI